MDAHTSPWRGRRVLVTGCTGFLGAAVTRELLDRGAHVVGLIRNRGSGATYVRERAAGQFDLVIGRVEDAIRLHTAMAVYETSAVFHLTGMGAPGQDRGIEAVLRAASRYHSRMPVVTARPADQLRLLTNEPEEPVLPLGVARFGELFGVGDRVESRIIPHTVAALLSGESISRVESPSRDFVFVRDAARACLALAEVVGAQSQPLDVTFRSGWELTPAGMAALVSEVWSGRTPVLAEGEQSINPLEWQPQTPFATALGESIAWYRDSLQSRSRPILPADAKRHAA